jgi:hypothetical protein
VVLARLQALDLVFEFSLGYAELRGMEPALLV